MAGGLPFLYLEHCSEIKDNSAAPRRRCQPGGTAVLSGACAARSDSVRPETHACPGRRRGRSPGNDRIGATDRGQIDRAFGFDAPADMSALLAQVSAKHRRDFIVMVVNGASSHVCKDLIVPKNVRLPRLLPYAPELNPQGHVWDELREKEFPTACAQGSASVVGLVYPGDAPALEAAVALQRNDMRPLLVGPREAIPRTVGAAGIDGADRSVRGC